MTWPKQEIQYNPGCDSHDNKADRLPLTLSHSSAEGERGSTHLNIMKNNWRTCLSHTRLSALIHLSEKTTEHRSAISILHQAGERGRNREERFVFYSHFCSTCLQQLSSRNYMLETLQEVHNLVPPIKPFKVT